MTAKKEFEDKICEWENCPNTFTPITKRTKYCSENHYKNCENCQTLFLVTNMKRPPKCCSQKCSNAIGAENAKDNINSEDRQINKICEYCGDPFITAQKNAKYCSKDHKGQCIVCQKDYAITDFKRPAKTCSKKCAATLIDFTERNNKSIATTREKYGVDNISQSLSIKELKKQTTFKNYGVENPSQSKIIQDRRKETLINHYGVENPMFSKEIKDTLAETNLKKYGVVNVFQNKEIKEKITNTLIEKYGVHNISQLPENRAKVVSTTLDRFGVESVLQLPENQLKASRSNKNRISKVNKKWQRDIVNKTGILFDLEKLIGDSAFADLGYNDILIDINPSITHNSTISYPHFTNICKIENCEKKSHRPKKQTYHQDRALLAENNNKILLQYFDWYDKNIFLNIIKSKLKLCQNTVYARKCELREITQAEANKFFKDNHLFGASNGQTLCLGLFYQGELVHCQSYGLARFNKNVEWEGIRSCSKLDYHIPGAFSKCDKYFFNKVNPNSVISYVDLSISQGATDALFDGWQLLRVNKPSAMWVKATSDNLDYPLFIRDSAARRISADKLLGFEVGDKYPRFDDNGAKITNDFVLLSEGYLKVYDAGVKVFVWRKGK